VGEVCVHRALAGKKGTVGWGLRAVERLVVGHASPPATAAKESGWEGHDAHDGVGHSTQNGAHDRDVHAGWCLVRLLDCLIACSR
jgi:hypothetical protein